EGEPGRHSGQQRQTVSHMQLLVDWPDEQCVWSPDLAAVIDEGPGDDRGGARDLAGAGDHRAFADELQGGPAEYQLFADAAVGAGADPRDGHTVPADRVCGV